MPDRDTPWEVQRHRGSADELHHLDLSSSIRTVHVMELESPAVALGSTQSEAVLAATVRAGGTAVTRRHSGGGLVVLTPGEIVWIDVIVPAGDPLWRTDVGEAFVWLGRVWAAAVEETLAARGGPSGGAVAHVHRGAPAHADLGRAVCFAGAGSGEVLLEGRKVVGMSQRRTRDWARFQCLVHGRFDADDSLRVLAPHLVAGSFGARLAARLATGVGVVPDLAGLADRFVDHLQLT